MRVHVVRVPRPNVEQTVDVEDGATVEKVVRALGLHPDAVLVVRGQDAIPIDAPLEPEDRLRLVTVASGG